MLTLKGPVDSFLNRVVTRAFRSVTPVSSAGKISFVGTKMEVARAWNDNPTAAEFLAVASSKGPFPEMREKDL